MKRLLGLAVCCLGLASSCILDRSGNSNQTAGAGGATNNAAGGNAQGGGSEGGAGGMLTNCGNDAIDSGEACDGADLAGATCESVGLDGGVLSCDENCQLVTSGCIGWVSPEYGWRIPITVKQNLTTQPLDKFPLLVVIKDNRQLAANANANGYDLLFTDSENNKIPFEIESYTAAGLVAWVSVTLQPAEEQKLYLYYGNLNCSELYCGDEAATEVWNEDFLAVWHLAEETTANQTRAGHHKDSTAGGHDGDQFQNYDVPGAIGRAQFFDGIDDEIRIGQATEIPLGEVDFTVSIWARTIFETSQTFLVKSLDPDLHVDRDKVFGANGHSDINTFGMDHGFVAYTKSDPVMLTDGAWHHLVIVQQKGVNGANESLVTFFDGEGASSPRQLNTRTDDDNHSMRIGGRANGAPYDVRWQGALDELRISKVVRTPEWIKASFTIESAPLDATQVGPAQQYP